MQEKHESYFTPQDLVDLDPQVLIDKIIASEGSIRVQIGDGSEMAFSELWGKLPRSITAEICGVENNPRELDAILRLRPEI